MKIMLSLVFILFAGNISASYMSECEALIGKWKECGGDAGSCSSIEEEITSQCKCHTKKGGTWKLVNDNIMGAGDSNVCGYVPEDIGPPPAPKPPRRPVVGKPDPGKGGAGNDEKGGR